MAAHRRGRSTPQVLQFARWRLEFHARLLLLPAGVVVYTASDAALSEVSAGHCNFVTDSPAGNSVRMSTGDCGNQIICSNRAYTVVTNQLGESASTSLLTGNATLKHTQIRMRRSSGGLHLPATTCEFSQIRRRSSETVRITPN